MRKAREQVKYMVIDKVSPSKIRNYLNRWVTWWQNTTKIWDYEEIIKWFCAACFDVILAAIDAAVSQTVQKITQLAGLRFARLVWQVALLLRNVPKNCCFCST